jgi:LPXTG-site transpeptidase (sortase) family protein
MMLAAVAAAAVAAGSSPPVSLPAQSSVGTISIPRIHLVAAPITMGSQQMYQQGVNWPPELNSGPAIYPKRCLDYLVYSNGRKKCDQWLKPVLPWQNGTVALAGHRVTHTHPFRWVNLLRKGDIIRWQTPWETFVYRVWTVKVEPSDSWKWVLKWGGPNSHTLVGSGCNPPGFATSRIVFFAKQVKTILRR